MDNTFIQEKLLSRLTLNPGLAVTCNCFSNNPAVGTKFASKQGRLSHLFSRPLEGSDGLK